MHIYGTQTGSKTAMSRQADPTTHMLEKLRLAMMATVELAIKGLTVIAVDCDSLSVPHLMVARPEVGDSEARVWLDAQSLVQTRQANVLTYSFVCNGVNVRWLETIDAPQALAATQPSTAGVQEAA